MAKGNELKTEQLPCLRSYIFELGSCPTKKEPLLFMRHRLVNPNDVDVINIIVEYEIPYIHDVVHSDDGGNYLYICTYAGKINPNNKTALESLDSFPVLSQIIKRPVKTPLLASLLFYGAVYESSKTEKIQEINEQGILSLDICDIFVVIGAPGTGKTTAAGNLIDKLRGSSAIRIENQPRSIAGCIERIRINNFPDFTMVEKVETVKKNIDEISLNRKVFIETFKQLQLLLSGHISIELAIRLDNILTELLAKQTHTPYSLIRLIKNIYALPINDIVYSDNGDAVIQEALTRLNGNEKWNLFFKQLSELRQVYDNSVEWFSELAQYRKKLLSELTVLKNEFITKEQKRCIVSLMEDIVLHLIKNTKEKSEANDNILIDFINGLEENQEEAYAYLSGYPVVTRGTLVVDADVYTNFEYIAGEVVKADKVVIFCSNVSEGINKLFFNAARARQELDGKPRIAGLCVNYRQPPSLCGFISNTFYEKLGMPPAKSLIEDENETVFVWISNGSVTTSVPAHILNIVAGGKNIAVFTSNIKGFQNYLFDAGISEEENSNIFIGSKPENCRETYSAVYYILEESFTEISFIAALGRAEKMFIVVGNPEQIKNNVSLRAFYQKCVGDSKYGKFYR